MVDVMISLGLRVCYGNNEINDACNGDIIIVEDLRQTKGYGAIKFLKESSGLTQHWMESYSRLMQRNMQTGSGRQRQLTVCSNSIILTRTSLTEHSNSDTGPFYFTRACEHLNSGHCEHRLWNQYEWHWKLLFVCCHFQTLISEINP